MEDRITHYEDGLLDEIAVDATYVHLERMDKRCFFLLIGRPDGSEIAVWMRTPKGKLTDLIEFRGMRGTGAENTVERSCGCVWCDLGIPRRIVYPDGRTSDATTHFAHDSAEGPIRCTRAGDG